MRSSRRLIFGLIGCFIVSVSSATPYGSDLETDFADFIEYSDDQHCYLTMKSVSDLTDQSIFDLILAADTDYYSRADTKKIILEAIERGCDINQIDRRSQLSALQTSILFNQPELVDFLLDNGADKHQMIRRDGVLNGLNALQFAEFLRYKRSHLQEWGKLDRIIERLK